MKLVFDWDTRKARTNLADHHVTFDEAKTVFNDPLLLTFPDDFHSETEERLISIGYSSKQRLLLVVHTEHETADEVQVRIISCRKVTAAERRNYEE